MAYIKLEDENGRITHVPVFNESEDGSGTWHVPVCDSSGYLKVALQGGIGGLVITNDGTKTTLLGTAGDYVRIGDAATTQYGLNSEDDLLVTGELEVRDLFVGAVSYNIKVANDKAGIYFGDRTDSWDSLLKWESENGLSIRNGADDDYKDLKMNGFSVLGNSHMSGGYLRLDNASFELRAGDTNDYYVMLTARTTDTGDSEIARMQGAADPYFGLGGSQEAKFYHSGLIEIGAFTLGGKLTAGANEIEGSAFDINGGTMSGVTLDGTLLGGNNDLGTQASPVGSIIAKNNAGIEFLDSGGTQRLSILLDGNNKFRIRNIAGGSIELYTDNASGAGNPATRLTMTGSVALSAVTWENIAAYTIGCASYGVLGHAAQAQQAHIIDANGSIEDITTKFNTLLADLEGYGFLAAS